MQRGDDTLPFDEPVEDPRPAANPIEMETVRARAELALFGRAAPPKLGRYHIIDRIAGGGMGVVYSAYDPELDRRVALKVVHPRRTHDGEAQARLVLEARALAKLDHPNVVKVHDVVTNDGSIVIVMELVVGETLAAWADKPHTWRDAVHVYQQAARGLEAAHGVKVVHRDFKPSNAVIGTDGRVRVLDFGLARSAEATGDDARGSGAPVSAGLTATGDVLGTIAYASPEQLRGEPATPASDQFSLCVSLHHAVEGVAPFAAASFEERRKNIEAGAIILGDSARDVPAWLRAVIARGLSPRAADRFPDMAALVHELVRPRGIRRFRTPLLVAGTLGLGVAATLALRGASTDEECDGGRAQLATAWNPSVRANLLKVLDAIGTPYAREIRDRAIGDLDQYASKWSASHLAACRDHRKGATSATLLDRRMTCLDERLADLRAAATVIEQTDRNSLANVMDVVVRVPPVERCSDLERLRLDVEPPEGEILREQVRVVRSKIAKAEALARSGQSEAAREAADDALAAAIQTPYKPVHVEAALAKSRTLMAFGEVQAAMEPLMLARTTALEQAMIPAAVEAGARLVYAESMLEASRTNAQRDAAFLEPLSKRQSCADFARPLLLNNLGVAFLSAGDRAKAFAYFKDARSAFEDATHPDLELTIIDRNLAMLTSDDIQRTEISASVVRRFRDALGAVHPTTLEAIWNAAEYEVDPAKAYELAQTATEALRKFHPTLVHVSALAEAGRAYLASELSDRTRARKDYTLAIARIDESGDSDFVTLRSLVSGELALMEGHPEAARAEFLKVLAARAQSTAWWNRLEVLRAELGLGAAALALGDQPQAIARLEAAINGLPEVIRVNEYLLPRRLLARAERLLAQAHRARHEEARAEAYERDARNFYERGPLGYAWVLKELSL
ncbi:MAG TPA: serine/threonine-protein kinase [Kofleriaceae bacterium]|nr:serine/threonine-protein kinase [Kofleriaceae bacterium]